MAHNVLDISNPSGGAYDGASGSGVASTLVGGKYTTTPPTSSDGQVQTFRQDINGRLLVSLGTLIAGEDLANGVVAVAAKPVAAAMYAPSSYRMPATAVTTAVVKASAGAVLSLRAINTNAAARYLQIHNTSSAPAGGATALRSFVIPAGTAANPAVLMLDRGYFADQVFCPTGISFAFSTTRDTYTAATAGDHDIDINYL